LSWLDHTQIVALSPIEIDLEDRTYFIPSYIDIQALVTSIERVGILNRPFVQKTLDKRFIPVLGRRRLKAAAEIGISAVKVIVIDSDVPEPDLFRLAFWDNMALRELDPASTAGLVNRILELYPIEVAHREFLSVLGVATDGFRLQRFKSIAELEDTILQALAVGRIHEKTAFILSKMVLNDRQHVFRLVQELRLNANKAAEIVGHLFDLSVTMGTSIVDLLDCGESRSILVDSNASIPEKTAQFRTLLRRWKYPEQSLLEQDFHNTFQQVNSTGRISVSPTPSFENKKCTIKIHSDSWEEAHTILKALNFSSFE
jgi:hypothetical protein